MNPDVVTIYIMLIVLIIQTAMIGLQMQSIESLQRHLNYQRLQGHAWSNKILSMVARDRDNLHLLSYLLITDPHK